MTNAELIKALQCASHFALYQDCYEKNCYANSGKGLYCKIPKLMADSADALEAADKRIAELMPKEGVWIWEDSVCSPRTCSVCKQKFYIGRGWNYCPSCGARMQTVTDCHTLEEGERC